MHTAKTLKYDKDGDNHYDITSAFIKSMRNYMEPDAVLYWLARMIESGEKPEFIARRIIICAAEDVGLANPAALQVAVAAAQAVERVGWPESRIILAEAALMVACSPKSNACYIGIDKALEDVRRKRRARFPFICGIHTIKEPGKWDMAKDTSILMITPWPGRYSNICPTGLKTGGIIFLKTPAMKPRSSSDWNKSGL